MAVHAVNFNLQSSVVLNQSGIRVLAALQLPLQELDLVVLVLYFHLHISDLRRELDIRATFLVQPALNIEVLVLVPHLQRFNLI